MSTTATPTKRTRKPKAETAPAVESSFVAGSVLAAEFDKAIRLAVGGKITAEKKQSYYRLMKDGQAICYIHTHKKHTSVTFALSIVDPGDVPEAVQVIEKAVALAAKAAKA